MYYPTLPYPIPYHTLYSTLPYPTLPYTLPYAIPYPTLPYPTRNFIIYPTLPFFGRRAGLIVRASDSGARGRGFDPHSGHRVVSLSKTHLPPKVLVIARKWRLCPNMTEKLFTWTLRIKSNNQATLYPSL